MSALTIDSRWGRARRLAPNALGLALTVCVVALGWWLMERPLVRGYGADYHAPVRAGGDAAATMTAAGIPAVAAPLAPIPGAGLTPSAYAVRVADANTAAGAILRLQQMGASAPAGTYAPIPNRIADAYRVFVGAYTTSTDAEALLRDLRAHGQLSNTSGTLVRLPLAFLIERNLASNTAASRVAEYVVRGLPAYALRQQDGGAWIYAGAFAAAADTTPLGDVLRAAGVRAVLAYRTGRPF